MNDGLIFCGAETEIIGDSTSATNTTIPLLFPGEAITISKTIEVSSHVEPYSKSSVIGHLHLQPVNTKDHAMPEEIETSPLNLQISSRYEYNANSDAVLVTNPNTSKAAYTAWKSFMDSKLGFEIDVFNIGLYGTMTLPESVSTAGHDIFDAYRGKTIIILCNEFPYFAAGTRTAFDLCTAP